MDTSDFFFFKQKTAYEMRISDWSSDVCSSDLHADQGGGPVEEGARGDPLHDDGEEEPAAHPADDHHRHQQDAHGGGGPQARGHQPADRVDGHDLHACQLLEDVPSDHVTGKSTPASDGAAQTGSKGRRLPAEANKKSG